MTGIKYDQGKLRWDLLPVSAIEQIVEVMTFGAAKYAADSWQDLPEFDSRYYAALQRHLCAWRQGEQTDPESGLPHLAHAACCLVFLLSSEVGFDRRLTGPNEPASVHDFHDSGEYTYSDVPDTEPCPNAVRNPGTDPV